MTSTAHEDQFSPEPGLEDECRKARAKANDICYWYCFGIEEQWEPSCRDISRFTKLNDPVKSGFIYCPFCKKKIEVRE